MPLLWKLCVLEENLLRQFTQDFYRPHAFSVSQPTSSKHLKEISLLLIHTVSWCSLFMLILYRETAKWISLCQWRTVCCRWVCFCVCFKLRILSHTFVYIIVAVVFCCWFSVCEMLVIFSRISCDSIIVWKWKSLWKWWNGSSNSEFGSRLIYTVGHKKRAPFIFSITLANIDRFS